MDGPLRKDQGEILDIKNLATKMEIAFKNA